MILKTPVFIMTVLLVTLLPPGLSLAARGGMQPFNANEFYRISIPTNNARVVGLFKIGCEIATGLCVSTLNAVRFANLTERAKPDILCTDSVCSPLQRDIVTVSVGLDVGADFGGSGGYAGVADAEVGAYLSLGLGGGLEWGVTGPMKIKPAANSDFQSGGNLLAESGLGPTMFSTHAMVGMRRFFGVTGNVFFYGEKSPDTVLMVGAIQRDGSTTCVDEQSNPTTCTSVILTLLEDLCDDQSRCRDAEPLSISSDFPTSSAETRFGGLDKEDLDEAILEAQGVIAMFREDVRNRMITSRLNDIQMLFEELRNPTLRQTVRSELELNIQNELEDMLLLVSTNSRFREVDLARVEDLPNAEDITEAIAELLNPLLKEGSDTVSQTSEKTRAKFCATNVGSRPAFDNYCGR